MKIMKKSNGLILKIILLISIIIIFLVINEFRDGYKIIYEYNFANKVKDIDAYDKYNLDYSKNITRSSVELLRAGGGGSSGGSSGSGSSGGHTTGSSRSNKPTSIIDRILSYIIFFVLFFFSIIVFYLKVLRASINSRRLLRLLDDKDKSWNYKNIEKQVIETFYLVQESWTNMDMTPSKHYMDDDLYESFTTKLEWMQMGNKRNVLKKIKLVDLKPISIYDDSDDSKDLIWFYIKGKMIDYIINTETNEKQEGYDYSKSFVEFWKFVRKDDRWVLAKILQKEEADLIKFQDI